MLPKPYRLTSRDLRHFTGRRFVSPALHLIASPSSLSHSRSAIVISKRVFLKAHDRNRLRRVLTHTLRPHLSAPPFFDLLIIAQPAAGKAPEAQILNNLQQLLSQLTPNPLTINH